MERLQKAHWSGMESGDMLNGFRCWCGSNILAYCSGYPLDELHQKESMLLCQLRHYRIDILTVLVEPFEAMVAHLNGSSDSPINWNEIEKADPAASIPSGTLRWSYWCWAAVQLAYYFRRLELGYRLLAPFAKLSAVDTAYFSTSICIFFSGLTCSGLAKKTGKRKFIIEARKQAAKMKFIMRSRGLNNLHRYLLMQADLLAATRKKGCQTIKQSYDKAIATAAKSGFIHDAALGNELAGDYFRHVGDGYWADQYIIRACELYHEWGAHAKVEHLKNEHASFIDPAKIILSKSRMKSSVRISVSGEESNIHKSVDLDSLSYSRTSITDATKELSAVTEELSAQKWGSSASDSAKSGAISLNPGLVDSSTRPAGLPMVESVDSSVHVNDLATRKQFLLNFVANRKSEFHQEK